MNANPRRFPPVSRPNNDKTKTVIRFRHSGRFQPRNGCEVISGSAPPCTESLGVKNVSPSAPANPAESPLVFAFWSPGPGLCDGPVGGHTMTKTVANRHTQTRKIQSWRRSGIQQLLPPEKHIHPSRNGNGRASSRPEGRKQTAAWWHTQALKPKLQTARQGASIARES
jgi:hypothetical protein